MINNASALNKEVFVAFYAIIAGLTLYLRFTNIEKKGNNLIGNKFMRFIAKQC